MESLAFHSFHLFEEEKRKQRGKEPDEQVLTANEESYLPIKVGNWRAQVKGTYEQIVMMNQGLH